jgi:hypothetical protein
MVSALIPLVCVAKLQFSSVSLESIYQYIHLDLLDKRRMGRRISLDRMVNFFISN